MQLFGVKIPLSSFMENEPILQLVINKRLHSYSNEWVPLSEKIFEKLSKAALADRPVSRTL